MNSDLQTLCSPSCWSRRLPQDQILIHHLNYIENASNNTRKNIQCELNLAYGGTNRQKIDIIGTDLPKESPILMYIHGGYWQVDEIHRSSYHFLAENLHKNGIKSVFIGYDLCPNVSLSEIVEEIKKAVKKCLCNAISGVYVMGHSAGAHLIAMLFTNFYESLTDGQKELLKCCFLVSGVYDLAPLSQTTLNDQLKLNQSHIDSLSPKTADFCKQISTNFFLIVGEHESPEFIKQSKEFHDKLIERSIKSIYYLMDNVDHFDIIENLCDDSYALTKLLINECKQ